MSTLLVAELVLACVLLAILLLVVGMIWRRRAIASGYPMALAAVSRDGRRWRLGLLRLGPTTLGWYPVVATSTRPRLEWDRAHLELSTPTDETVSIPGLSDAVRVDVGDWQRATLGTEADVDCWRQWFLPWNATPGRHDLTVRATDGTGEVALRPLELGQGLRVLDGVRRDEGAVGHASSS